MVNTRTFLRHTVREKSCPYFYFFSPPYFFSPFFFIDSLNDFFLLLFSFSFFLSSLQTHSNGHFFFSFSFILFLSFLLHRNTWVTLSTKKENTWVPISQTQKIKPINTWYRSYTLTQTQTHKHVHPHNKSKNFFSKHKQNPEVRNERKEKGGEEGWNRSCMPLI